MNWKYDEIEKILEQLKFKISLGPINDKYDMYVEEYAALANLYNIVKSYQTPDLFVTRGYNDYCAKLREKNDSFINKNQSLKNILTNDSTHNLDSHLIYFPTFVSTKKLYQLMSTTLDKEESSLFISLFNNNGIQALKKSITKNVLGRSTHLISVNKNLVSFTFDHSIKSSYVLVHELSHISLLNHPNNIDLNSETYYYCSYFKEAYPIFNQLLYLDRITGSKNEIENNMLDCISTYKNFCIHFLLDNRFAPYVYSYLLALYFFKLYKEDRTKFNKHLNEFKSNSFKLNDSDLLNSLNITESDFSNVFDYYYSSYEDKKVKHV